MLGRVVIEAVVPLVRGVVALSRTLSRYRVTIRLVFVVCSCVDLCVVVMITYLAAICCVMVSLMVSEFGGARFMTLTVTGRCVFLVLWIAWCRTSFGVICLLLLWTWVPV